MTKISAVIITYNEEQYLDQCLSSLEDVADEIVVVDSYSTDRTRQIAEARSARFILHEFEGYIEQKNWAVAQASHPYILSLDGDEMLSEELRTSILGIKDDLRYDGYFFNRLNNFYGTWVRHSGVYPNRKIRLFHREKGIWGGINPHDRFILQKGTRKTRLNGDLLHYMYSSLEDHLDKIMNFTSISAASHYKMGIRSNPYKLIVHPTWRFLRDYFINQGFRDGLTGYTVCYLNAYAGYLKYLKLQQLEKRSREMPGITISNA
jgi:glycosyltransferase involved in cell wall biosynthesis